MSSLIHWLERLRVQPTGYILNLFTIVRMSFKHANSPFLYMIAKLFCLSFLQNMYIQILTSLPLASAILSYCGFSNLVGHKRIYKWFQKEVKLAPYCLLQHVPWIHITLTYRIHVESSPYAEAKRYPNITLVNFGIFSIDQLINLKLIDHICTHYETSFHMHGIISFFPMYPHFLGLCWV